MRNVRWARDASDDLGEIVDFIARDNPHAAIMVRLRVEEAANILGKRPIGRPGRMLGLFEKSVLKTSCILAYRLKENEIQIIRVMHSAQNWTADNWPEG